MLGPKLIAAGMDAADLESLREFVRAADQMAIVSGLGVVTRTNAKRRYLSARRALERYAREGDA